MVIRGFVGMDKTLLYTYYKQVTSLMCANNRTRLSARLADLTFVSTSPRADAKSSSATLVVTPPS